ncbi:MAG: hypothetical protein ABI763_15965 [Bacteroidota bacterium]
MKKLLRILSILSLVGILALCVFSWFSGDDLCYRNELARYSVLDKAWLQYMYWDGRSTGLASLIQLAGLKYFPAAAITLIWAFSFICMSVMILKIIKLESHSGEEKNISLVETALLSAMLWVGMWKLIPDIIYWPTGGWYCMMGLLALTWIYQFLKGINTKRFTARKNLFIFLISLLCANNSHNVIIPLIFLALIEGVKAIVINQDRKVLSYVLSALAGLAISTIFVLFAPGNFERLKAISWQGFNLSLINYCLIVFAKYCYWLLALFLLFPVFAWLNGLSLGQTLNNFFPGSLKEIVKNKKSLIASLYNHKFLVAAFSTVFVFSATSFFAVPRTAIFFAMFIVIYVVQKSSINFQPARSKKFVTGSVIFLSFFIGIVIFEMVKVNALQNVLESREAKYRLNQRADVTVDAIPESNVPFAFTFVDISADSGNWVNRCVASNSNIKTVRTVLK